MLKTDLFTKFFLYNFLLRLPHPKTISTARLSWHPGCLLGDCQNQGAACRIMGGDDPGGAVFVSGGIAAFGAPMSMTVYA